jgi:hypothetical protein
MAIWQHDFHFIPQSKLKDHFGEIPQTISDGDCDHNWWQDVPLSFAEELGTILPYSDNQWSQLMKNPGERSKSSYLSSLP